MELRARAAVGHFQVLEALDERAYQAKRAYLAEPPARLGLAPGEQVLVRELTVEGAGWDAFVRHLLRFCSAKSSHLLALLEVGPLGESGAYLVSEPAPGGTLAAPTKPLDISAKALAVAAAARGAHALHQVGMAHGGIRGGSIFLTARGPVLGPAVPLGHPGVVARVRRWQDVALLDPDLLSGNPPSRLSDVWALAATIHELCAATPLYPGIESARPVTAVQRVLFGQPAVSPELPEELARVLEACFDQDPGRRPATAAELADRLEVAAGSRVENRGGEGVGGEGVGGEP